MAVQSLGYIIRITVALCLVLTGCFSQTPKKPELSSFTAKLSVLNAGQEIDEVLFLASVEEKKQLQIVYLGTDPHTDVVSYTWEIVKKNETVEYDTIKPFGYCVGMEGPDDPGFANLWYWLKKATYNGTKTFNGQNVDVWTHEDKKTMTFFEVGVLSSNPNEPLYYFSTEAMGVIVFHNYDGNPPPPSAFDLPDNCQLEPGRSLREGRSHQGHVSQYKNVFKSKIY